MTDTYLFETCWIVTTQSIVELFNLVSEGVFDRVCSRIDNEVKKPRSMMGRTPGVNIRFSSFIAATVVNGLGQNMFRSGVHEKRTGAIINFGITSKLTKIKIKV